MATIKGFIFDLDGVLADTVGLHFRAWQEIASRLGIQIDENDNEQLKGVGRRESLQSILEWGARELGGDEFEKLLEQKNELYRHYLTEREEEILLPGARNFLAESVNSSLKVALGSASQNAKYILQKAGIAHFFEVVVSGLDISRQKPDPQVFQIVAEQLALEPGSLVVFEDSQAGIEAARRGGFRSVGVGNSKLLKKAELHISSLEQTTPASVINTLNF